jgi:serine/threonine protein kinase
MIDRLGTVKVVDFGRAIIMDEKVNFLLGSPMYMAPEMHKRQPGRLQSDFFSIGLVGLQLLTGSPLTTQPNVTEQELLQLKLSLAANLSDILPAHVKKRRTLTRILRRFLEAEPKRRFNTAAEAEAGEDSLAVVDKQLTKEGENVEYGRLLSEYLGKLVDTKTQRVETDDHGESRREPNVNVTQRVD